MFTSESLAFRVARVNPTGSHLVSDVSYITINRNYILKMNVNNDLASLLLFVAVRVRAECQCMAFLQGVDIKKNQLYTLQLL